MVLLLLAAIIFSTAIQPGVTRLEDILDAATRLQQALTAQGKSTAEIDAQFDTSWARSDTWIRSSRF